jgi:hypothetical protein
MITTLRVPAARLPMKRSASSVASSAQCASSTTITEWTENSSRSAVRSPCLPRRSRNNAANGAMSLNGASGLGVDSGSHAPHNTRSPAGHACTNERARLVFPTPASPPTSASRPVSFAC